MERIGYQKVLNIDHVEAAPQKRSEKKMVVKKNIDCRKEHQEGKSGSHEVYGWEGLEEEGNCSQGRLEGEDVGSWGGVRDIVIVTSAAFEVQVVVVS